MAAIICRTAENVSELEECFRIRHEVFVREQSLFAETDRDHKDDKSLHLIALQNERIIGTVRIYKDPEGIFWGGRLAVRKRYRGKAGRLLVLEAVNVVRQQNAQVFRACIQKENADFFKSLGWSAVEEEKILYGKPHIVMEAPL